MRLNASREGVSGQVSPAGLRAVTEGIDPYTVFRHLKVEMGSGGVSGGAGDADDIALIDILPHAHLPAGHMGIQRRVAAAVRDDHIVAVRTGILGHDHGSRLSGIDRAGIAHPADVGTLVVGGSDAAGDARPPTVEVMYRLSTGQI